MINTELTSRIQKQLTAEKAHLNNLLGDGISASHLGKQHACKNQIQFYEIILQSLNTNDQIDRITREAVVALKLLAMEKTRQHSENNFMTWQSEDSEGEFSVEEITNSRWSIMQLNQFVKETRKDTVTFITGIARFYRINPNSHLLHLQGIFTHGGELWKQGLILTEEQLYKMNKQSIKPEFEPWRFWPLYNDA